MRAVPPIRLCLAASLLVVLALPQAGFGRVEAPRAAAPKPATVSIPAPSEGDLTIARITLQAKKNVAIRPKLSVVNGGALDAELEVFGFVKPVKGKKGRFEAWVLVMSPVTAETARVARRQALLADPSLSLGVQRGKLAPGSKGVHADTVVNPLRASTFYELCGTLDPDADAAAGLLFGTPIPEVEKPNIADDVCGQSAAFFTALLGVLDTKLVLGVGPHGIGKSPMEENATAPAGSAISVTVDSPGAGSFVDNPSDTVTYEYRMLGIVGEAPFDEGNTCFGGEIQAFGPYVATGSVESYGRVSPLSGSLDVGPANNPLADCPVSSTDPAPSQVDTSWCYWPDKIGIVQVRVKGAPNSRVHVEIEGPPGSKGNELSEAARTTKLPATGELVFRTNVFKIGEYEIKVGNVFGRPTFEATVDTAEEPPASPSPPFCENVM